MFLSIIVPTYNVESVLGECIASLANQNISSDDYEILIISDGSSDNCDAILDEYLMNTPNTQVIHKENGGVSSARNKGLEIATGDYVWFVDSDDFIEDNILCSMYEKLSSEKPEHMSIGGYHMESIELTEKESEDRAKGILPIGKSYIWGQIFSNEIIQTRNIRFNENISIAEDTVFWFEFSNYQVTEESHYDRICYFYRNMPNSLMHQSLDKNLPSMINMSILMRTYSYDKEIQNNLYAEFSATNCILTILESIIKVDAKTKNNTLNCLRKKELLKWNYIASKEVIKKFEDKKINKHKIAIKYCCTPIGYCVVYGCWLLDRLEKKVFHFQKNR